MLTPQCYLFLSRVPLFPKLTLSCEQWGERRFKTALDVSRTAALQQAAGSAQRPADGVCQRGQTGSAYRTLRTEMTGRWSLKHGSSLSDVHGHQEQQSTAPCLTCRLDSHCQQKSDPETQIRSFHSCPNAAGLPTQTIHTVTQERKTKAVSAQSGSGSSWRWCFFMSSGLLLKKLQSTTLKTSLF